MNAANSTLRVELLGAVRVWLGPREVNLGPHKQRAVFATLAIRANCVVSLEDSMRAIWQDRPPHNAAAVLHTYIARLRRLIEPGAPPRARSNVISSTEHGYRLNVHQSQMDLLRMRSLVAVSRRMLADGNWPHAFDLLAEAVRLRRTEEGFELADLLPDWPEVNTVQLETLDSRLQYVALGVAHDLAATVLPTAERLAVAEPLHEAVQAQYLLALSGTGQRAAAIEWYRRVRTRLREDLGVDPGADLGEAYRQVLSGSDGAGSPIVPAAAAAEDQPPWRGGGPVVGEVVGRTSDLAELCDVVTQQRLVTVTGVAGSGKTTLALSLCERLRMQFRGGVAVVDLSTARDSADVRATLHRVLVGPLDADWAALMATLAQHEMLIVLDNADRVVDASADVVDEILRLCPGVLVVVTSRELLGLPYETVWRVSPLSAPGDMYADAAEEVMASPAVEFFARRAAQARPDFRVDLSNAALVADICRRLDGLPLALELAAAGLRAYDLEWIAQDVRRGLRQVRLYRRGIPPHHHSLHLALRWTYDLLDPAERHCLACLCHLRREFNVECAIGVCAQAVPSLRPHQVLRTLGRLVDKSLLEVRHGRRGTHYRVLEPVRLFVRQLSPAV